MISVNHPLCRSQRRGVTMIELVMASTMLVILGGAMGLALKSINKSVATASQNLKTLEKIQIGLSHIDRFLKSAKRSTIVITQEPGEHPHSKVTFTSIAGDQYEIFQSGTDLVTVRNGNRTVILRGGLLRVSFAYPNLMDDSWVRVGLSTNQNQHVERGQPDDPIDSTVNLIHLEHL